MGAAEETQLIYIKGLMTEFNPEKIEKVEAMFDKFMGELKQDEEMEAIGMVVLARWGIEQSMNT